MIDFFVSNYLYLKALHVIAIIAWMAGLLYLPRLFVYHAAAKNGSELSETLKIMERRLLRYIMNPAMIVAWVLGLGLIALNTGLMQQGWIHAKLLLVVLMSAMHMAFALWRKDFEMDTNTKSQRFYRIWNEGPTVLMIIIVILAIAKPF